MHLTLSCPRHLSALNQYFGAEVMVEDGIFARTIKFLPGKILFQMFQKITVEYIALVLGLTGVSIMLQKLMDVRCDRRIVYLIY